VIALLHKLKRTLQGLRAKDALMNLDFVISQGTSLVISGWVAHKSLSINQDCLSVKQADNKVGMSIFSFQRDDVAQRLQLNNEDNCFGFIVIMDDFSGSIDNLTFEHSDTTFSISKLRYRQASNIAEILSNIPQKRDEAQAFFEARGLKLNIGSAGKAVIRHRDKDVEKIKGILQSIDISKAGALDVLANDALTDIQRIWKAKQSKNTGCELKTYGGLDGIPKVSVVIPLYGRYDFMQHQLANFSSDPFMKEVEIIYVLDDPLLQREVLITAYGIFQTFKYPFKLVLSERNRGFAGANNLGVEYATSETLLLLNSDILPSENGWLAQYLEQFYDLNDVGILGATLVYEDNTIQHVGMTFREDSHYPGIWMNHHPYKGVPVDLVPLDSVFESSITTGACMLMKTALYRELEGFDPMYVLGDFEDSDLCLKVIHHGLKIYVSGSTRLFHLERLSQDLVDSGDWKFKLTLANGVYQANKWRSLIQEIAV
jgi:GT2 family glycosyltransferase